MCKNQTVAVTDTADQGTPLDQEGTFLVIKGIDTHDLHIKGHYAVAELSDANARVEELRNRGEKASLVFVPAQAKGRTNHLMGSAVMQQEVCVKTETVEYLIP